MVGFISGVINKNSLDAHFVGIDYQLNREYAIYQRMLYDYVEIAISKGLKTLILEELQVKLKVLLVQFLKT